EAQSAIRNALDEHTSKEELVRFRFIAAIVTCSSMDDQSRTVQVEARTDRFVVPEGDTAGEIMDEASRVRMEEIYGYPRAAFGFDRDRSAGDVSTFYLEQRVTFPSTGNQDPQSGRWQRMSFGGWLSGDHRFYQVGADSHSASWHTDPRGMHIGAQFNVAFERQPFAGGTLTSNGFTLG